MIALSLLSSFLIGTEKVLYISVFYPKQSKLPLNSFVNCLIMKYNRMWNYYEILQESLLVFCILNYKYYG